MKEQRIREELTQCREVLSDLFQSGLAGAPESLIERCGREAKYVRQYGMEWLADKMTLLAEQLEKRRHVTREENEAEIVRLFCQIETFVEEGIRICGLEEAGVRIRKKEWEQED